MKDYKRLTERYVAEEGDFFEICPVCKYELETCQCLYSGSAHPDRHKRYEVVIDNLYLLTETQLRHIIFFATVLAGFL